MEPIKDILQSTAQKATDYSGSTSRKTAKGIVGVVIVLLLGALGLEVSGTDFDLGTLLNGGSLREATMQRDDSGNLTGETFGQACGDDSLVGGRDEYNCDDFSTQQEAQAKMDECIASGKDVNRLDGDKDGVACEALPKSTGN